METRCETWWKRWRQLPSCCATYSEFTTLPALTSEVFWWPNPNETHSYHTNHHCWSGMGLGYIGMVCQLSDLMVKLYNTCSSLLMVQTQQTQFVWWLMAKSNSFFLNPIKPYLKPDHKKPIKKKTLQNLKTWHEVPKLPNPFPPAGLPHSCTAPSGRASRCPSRTSMTVTPPWPTRGIRWEVPWGDQGAWVPICPHIQWNFQDPKWRYGTLWYHSFGHICWGYVLKNRPEK